MADHQDNLEEHEDSRPFLASTEAHQATLMKGAKKPGQKVADEDEPAPMLPSIVAASTSGTDPEESGNIETESTEAVVSESSSQETDSPLMAEHHEASHTQATNYYPNSRRIITGMAVTLTALAGFSAIWYNANQDIYTLGKIEETSQDSTQAASNPSPPQTTKPATLGAESGAVQTLSLNLENLPALSQGHYWLWLKQGENNISLGKFTVDDKGQAVTSENKIFKPQHKIGAAQSSLLVSIETADNPEQPSQTIILSGELKDGEAKLSFSAIDLSQASGVYTIAAPTDLSGDHQSSGIWFAKTDGHGLTGPGLTVPNAPEGWKYEAQLAYKDQIIAAGRFTNPNDRDDFGVFTPNPDHTPSFPGEDYIQGAPSRLGVDFPADLTTGEWKIIISIEPDLNGSDPTGNDLFFLQPFTAIISQDAENYKEYPLALDTAKFPSATVVAK